MVDIYLIRHGHVDYTPPNTITRHNPLTALGFQMALRAGERCAALRIQCLYASTMRRAAETADVLAQAMPGIPRIDMPAFEETSVSDLDGYDGIVAGEDLRAWGDDHFGHANARTWARAVAGWHRVECDIAEMRNERVAIVTHGGVINVLLRHFAGEEMGLIRRCWFDVDYASFTWLRCENGTRSIRRVNDTRHIEDLLQQA